MKNPELVNALIQLVISLCGAGVLVQLLMLRQNRRKVAGDASASEANAASTLSGAAIKMVENAQAKELEANKRADAAHSQLVIEREESDERRERDAHELETRAWRIHHLEMRAAILENALRQAGVEVPPEPDYEKITHRANAPLGLEGPRPSIEVEVEVLRPGEDGPPLG
jgi:hypothetical protein